MAAISMHTDCWIVRDPEAGHFKADDIINRTQVQYLSQPEYDRNGPRHPCAWLTRIEAERDARCRMRLFRALRRRWRLNRQRTLR